MRASIESDSGRQRMSWPGRGKTTPNAAAEGRTLVEVILAIGRLGGDTGQFVELLDQSVQRWFPLSRHGENAVTVGVEDAHLDPAVADEGRGHEQARRRYGTLVGVSAFAPVVGTDTAMRFAQ